MRIHRSGLEVITLKGKQEESVPGKVLVQGITGEGLLVLLQDVIHLLLLQLLLLQQHPACSE